MRMLYTQKNLARQFIRSQIEADPLNYSLKYRVIPLDNLTSEDLVKKSSQNIQLFELELAYSIAEAWHMSKDNYLNWFIVNDFPALTTNDTVYTAHNFSILAISRKAQKVIYCDPKDSLLRTDNLIYVNFDNFILSKSYPNGSSEPYSTHIKAATAAKYATTYMSKAILDMTAVILSKNSICKYLGFIFTKYRDNSLTDLEELTYLKTNLVNHDFNNPFIDIGATTCGYQIMSRKGKMCADLRLNNNVFFWDSGKEGDTPCIDDVKQLAVCNGVYAKITYGLELLHLTTKLEGTSKVIIRNSFIDRFCKNTGVMGIFYDYSKKTFYPEIEAIIKINNPQERYNAIKKYVLSDAITDTVAKIIDYELKILATDAKVLEYSNGVDEFYFTQFVKFATDEFANHVRVKTSKLLIRYCKLNKIELPDAMSLAYHDISNSDLKSCIDVSTKKPSLDNIPNEVAFEVGKFNMGKYAYVVKTDFKTKSKDEEEVYTRILSTLKYLSINLTRQIREIKVYNSGGKQSGLSTGKLDIKNLWKYRQSEDIFYKNTYKVKEMDLAFGIILDVSGSMIGEGINNGRVAMILLHETLKALGINHCIMTHTSDRTYQSVIKKYQCFKEDKDYKVCKNYALSTIRAETGNCDSAALYYMERMLNNVKNKDKICLMFSDGEPTECSEADLTLQVQTMNKKGIKVIGIGIDFPNISKYYPEYANGKDLKDMFNIITGILKEYVLAKKD